MSNEYLLDTEKSCTRENNSSSDNALNSTLHCLAWGLRCMMWKSYLFLVKLLFCGTSLNIFGKLSAFVCPIQIQ